MGKNLFVIGNGFDLDLGMKTKYSDFANNEKYWPKDDGVEITGLKAYLEMKRDLEKWFDMENELRNYAIYDDVTPPHIDSMNSDRDMKYFEKIREKLMEYLATQEIIELKTESVAAKVLKAVYDNGYFKSIYSFNYTDLNNILKKLCIGQQINYTHIHGSIKKKSIILGVDQVNLGVDQVRLRDGYDSIQKLNSEFYQSNSILNDLNNSDEIIFFGMSFGIIDNLYFKGFLKGITSKDSIPNNRRVITIFTYNEDSRREIIRNISDLKIDMTALFQNNISFIRTQDNMDSDKLDVFCKRLREKSTSANKQNSDNILSILHGL